MLTLNPIRQWDILEKARQLREIEAAIDQTHMLLRRVSEQPALFALPPARMRDCLYNYLAALTKEMEEL